MEIIKRLQTVVAPETFTPRVVYDGRKNIFAPRQLALGPTDSQEVCDHITNNNSIGVDVPIFLQEQVECLQLGKALRDLEHRSILPTRSVFRL